MTTYRCYFLDGNGKIVTAETLDAETLGEAVSAARRLCAGHISRGFELWHGSTRLHKHIEPTPVAPHA